MVWFQIFFNVLDLRFITSNIACFILNICLFDNVICEKSSKKHFFKLVWAVVSVKDISSIDNFILRIDFSKISPGSKILLRFFLRPVGICYTFTIDVGICKLNSLLITSFSCFILSWNYTSFVAVFIMSITVCSGLHRYDVDYTIIPYTPVTHWRFILALKSENITVLQGLIFISQGYLL